MYSSASKKLVPVKVRTSPHLAFHPQPRPRSSIVTVLLPSTVEQPLSIANSPPQSTRQSIKSSNKLKTSSTDADRLIGSVKKEVFEKAQQKSSPARVPAPDSKSSSQLYNFCISSFYSKTINPNIYCLLNRILFWLLTQEMKIH